MRLAFIETVFVDLAEPMHVERGLEEVDKRLGGMPPECVLFNAARSETRKLLE
jgi:hypothetical protein